MATTASMIAQFNRDNIDILKDLGYEVHVLCNFENGNTMPKEKIDSFKKELQIKGVKFMNMNFTRSPFAYGKNLKLAIKLRKIIKKNKYKIIHCQTPVGGVVARIASTLKIHEWGGRIIYTAHGFHFYKGAPKRNWMILYPIEGGLSWLTDTLITINKEDYQRAKKHFHAKEIKYVPGVGIDLEKYRKNPDERLKMRKELVVKDDEIMILSVGELIARKNHQIVINALKKINNEKIKYFIIGQGGLKDHLEKMIKDIGMGQQIKMLGYKENIASYCNAADLFIFPSLQEGLPVSLMEAMACKVPVLVSKIRGNIDLIHNENRMFSPHDCDELVDKLSFLIARDDALKSLMRSTHDEVEENYQRLEKFSKGYVHNLMKEIYEE